MFRLIQVIRNSAFLLPLVILSVVYQSFGVNIDLTETDSLERRSKEVQNYTRTDSLEPPPKEVLDYTETDSLEPPSKEAQNYSTKLQSDSSQQSDDEMARKFNKIRKFDSYDPATATWSTIEDFETVTILDDTSQKIENSYVYNSFWAYDSSKEQWHKVDISAYGYRLYEQDDQRRGEKKYLLRRFLRNLAINFNAGAGATFYKASLSNFNLIKQGEKFYIQATNNDAVVYEPRWLAEANSRVEGFASQDDDIIKRDGEVPDFKNVGLSVPLTPSLHYTLFKKVRIGGGGTLEINFLQKLKPSSSKGELGDFKTSGNKHYNVKYFGLLGYNITQRPDYSLVLDSQIGESFNLGEDVGVLFKKDVTYLHRGLFFNIGIGYERNITKYFRLLTRLAYEVKNPENKFKDHPDGSVKIGQSAIYLQVGISFNLAKDIEDKR